MQVLSRSRVCRCFVRGPADLWSCEEEVTLWCLLQQLERPETVGVQDWVCVLPAFSWLWLRAQWLGLRTRSLRLSSGSELGFGTLSLAPTMVGAAGSLEQKRLFRALYHEV